MHALAVCVTHWSRRASRTCADPRRTVHVRATRTRSNRRGSPDHFFFFLRNALLFLITFLDLLWLWKKSLIRVSRLPFGYFDFHPYFLRSEANALMMREVRVDKN